MGNACESDSSSPDHIIIEYFDAHGRPEPIRALLHHAGVPFSNDSVSLPGWAWRKTVGSTGEFGGLPIVRYQGRQMQQTGAILRALGTERGYYNPRDWQQAAKIDWLIDSFNELINVNAEIYFSFSSRTEANEKWQNAA